MIYGRALMRPAAAEVRQMLHRFKMDNMKASAAARPEENIGNRVYAIKEEPKLKPYEQ